MQTQNNGSKNYWLYVLKLEQDKYYFGITSKTPEIRMKEHQNSFLAAEWVKLYPPIAILDTRDLGQTTYSRAEEYENKVVRKYVKQYGINNVRGGNLSYSGDLIQRFGYYFDADGWKTAMLGLLAILALFLAFLLK